MFAKIDKVTYVASPRDPSAMKLLALQRDGRLKTVYLVFILVPGGLFLLVGVMAAFAVISIAPSWGIALAGVGVGILCAIGALAMGRAAMLIAQRSQRDQFRRFVHSKRILELPEACANVFYKLLKRYECTEFLFHYTPDPYDFGKLKSIVEEIGRGSRSPAYRKRRLKPALEELVNKISEAQRAQEEADIQVAQALDELPRPRPDDIFGS